MTNVFPDPNFTFPHSSSPNSISLAWTAKTPVHFWRRTCLFCAQPEGWREHYSTKGPATMNQIIKIGSTYINLGCVIYVDAENPKSLRMTFVDGQSKNFDGED